MPLIQQPQATVISVIESQLRNGPSLIRVAAAYATFSGVRLLREQTRIEAIVSVDKRFLIGIDWFRSEPAALEALAALRNSQVRIVDGEYLVDSRLCRPRRTFHPKAYFIGGQADLLIVGSANLSANGLARSIELSLTTGANADIVPFKAWFDDTWQGAALWSRIRGRYSSLYEAAKVREHVVTEDDDIVDPRVLSLRWVTPERLRILRAAQHLWVDVGGLHNRDLQGLPGTDLQFTQMTRVFFGRPATIVPGNSPLGEVRLTMTGAQPQIRPMKFNKSSSMDRLSLPIPGERGWPPKYDYETILFSKASDGSYAVELATGSRATWRRRSKAHGFIIRMQRGEREWGVF